MLKPQDNQKPPQRSRSASSWGEYPGGGGPPKPVLGLAQKYAGLASFLRDFRLVLARQTKVEV
jgi:hypothetical protein